MSKDNTHWRTWIIYCPSCDHPYMKFIHTEVAAKRRLERVRKDFESCPKCLHTNVTLEEVFDD